MFGRHTFTPSWTSTLFYQTRLKPSQKLLKKPRGKGYLAVMLLFPSILNRLDNLCFLGYFGRNRYLFRHSRGGKSNENFRTEWASIQWEININGLFVIK